MQRGVLYLMSGISSIDQLVVSIWSLRKHWEGNIAVAMTPDCSKAMKPVMEDKRLEFSVLETERLGIERHDHWIAKSCTYLQTPFEETIYMDADTIVKGDITPLFGRFNVSYVGSDDNPVRINQQRRHQFAGSLRKSLKNRLHEAGLPFKQLIDRMLKLNMPIINNGVMGFHKDHPVLHSLYFLGRMVPEHRLHDELAIQLLAPDIDGLKFLPEKYNHLVRYGQDLKGAIVQHYHNKSFCRHDEGILEWAPHFREALELNLGGMKKWAGRHNGFVRKVRRLHAAKT